MASVAIILQLEGQKLLSVSLSSEESSKVSVLPLVVSWYRSHHESGSAGKGHTMEVVQLVKVTPWKWFSW